MSRRDLGNIGLAFPHSVGVQTPQLDTAPDYESGGQEFESLRARQQASNATYILPIATCGLYYGLPISYQIATSVVGLILEVGPRSEPVPEICTVR